MKRVRKICSLLLVLALGLNMLTGCSEENAKSKEAKTKCSSGQIISHIYLNAPIDGAATFKLGSKRDYDESFLSFYGFEEDLLKEIKDYAIVKPLSPVADEYLVFKTDKVKEVKQVLEAYKEQRTGDFGGYAPSEEAKLSEAKILTTDNCVAYLVGEDFKSLKSLFEEAADEDYKLTDDDKNMYQMIKDQINRETENGDTETDWTNPADFPDGPEPGTKVDKDGTVLYPEDAKYMTLYDTSNIVQAYKQKDSSLLTDPIEQEILKVAQAVIEGYITDDMTMYEKEKAIHDYIVGTAENDAKALEYSTWYMQYSDMPYGVLVNKQAVCYGYSTTFKMFMDMLDIECLIVTGYAYYEDGIHGWNLVKLDDGCWYAVDVTWDDPYFYEGIYYNFFNTDDEYLLLQYHMWDQDAYPAAVGGKYFSLEEPTF